MRTFAYVHSTLFGGGRIRRKLLSFPAENPFRSLPIIPITQETHTLLHYGIIFFSVYSKNIIFDNILHYVGN